MKTRNKLHSLLQSSSLPTSLAGTVSLFLILATLTGKCEAQPSFPGSSITIYVIIFVAVGVFMCLLFWGCVCCMVYIFSRQQPTRTIQYTHNHQPQTHQGVHPQSQYPSGSQPYPRQTYHHPQSGYPAYSTPTPQPTATELQPVSLPEATLYQGDAPPGYEEAVRMRTVDFESDQNG